MLTDSNTLYWLLPEIILVLTATVIYLGGTFSATREGWSWLAAFGMAAAGYALLQQGRQDALAATLSDVTVGGLFSGPVVIDLFSQYFRFVILAAGLIFLLFSARTAANGQPAEFVGSLTLMIAGLMVVSVSNDLVLMFLGLEMVSIPTYVLLYLGGKTASSQESTAKYFFLSILSSALLLYGFSFLYGAAGSTLIGQIRDALADAARDEPILGLAKLGLVLVIAGLGFRLAAVPFHFYAPDVYQGTSQLNAGVLAVIPKIAALTGLVRVVVVGLPHEELAKTGWQLAMAMALLTMTLGNLLALWQTNVRRLLAYSSIAHAGYMLIGLAVTFAANGGHKLAPGMDGVGATMFYLLVYGLATIGSFAALDYLSGDKQQIDTVDELAGASRANPAAALCLAVCMFSLTGLPPLGGFWGKLALFYGALSVDSTVSESNSLNSWFIALAIAGVINAAISAAYYLRVVGALYFRQPVAAPKAQGGMPVATAMVVCTLATVLAGLLPGKLLTVSNEASRAAQYSFRAWPAAEQQSTLSTDGDRLTAEAEQTAAAR